MFLTCPSHSLRDDLIPEDSFLSLGVVSWEMVEYLQFCYATSRGDNGSWRRLPVILIQTSRPRQKQLLKQSRQLEDSKEFALIRVLTRLRAS